MEWLTRMLEELLLSCTVDFESEFMYQTPLETIIEPVHKLVSTLRKWYLAGPTVLITKLDCHALLSVHILLVADLESHNWS